MFEHYSESARQTIYRARWEAARRGSREIDPEHILLALLENESLVNDAFLGSAQAFRSEIIFHPPQGPSLSLPTDLPLSGEARAALALGNEEADVLSGGDVGNWHILLGLMRLKESRVARLLRVKGLSIEGLRTRIPEASRKPARQTFSAQTTGVRSEFTEILTKAAHLTGAGQHKAGLALIDDAISKTRDDWQVYALASLASVISKATGDLGLAIAYCKRRLGIDPEDPRSLYQLADYLDLNGEAQLARQYAARAHELSVTRGDGEGRCVSGMIEQRFPELKR